MIPCRVLPHQVGDGPTNMATDEALLDAVADHPGLAVVRTYTWSVPTLSLGYFQRYAEVEADPRWAKRAVVRRATGGGALWHDREVTYAVVIPVEHPLARPSTALYQAIHQAIGAAIRRSGVGAERRGTPGLKVATAAKRPFLCFLDQDPDDVVVGSTKLVGSAQRRRSGAVLQHGSILLARSPTTPELPGLADLVGDSQQRGDQLAATWIEILRASLPDVIGGAPIAGDLTDWERDQADTLRSTVYQEVGWTRRR